MTLLSSWVDVEVVNNLNAHNAQFTRAKPFPHTVIPNFLQKDKAEALLAALKKEKFTHKESDLFSLNQTIDLSDSKQEVLKKFYLFAASDEFATLMRQITGLSVDAGALDLAGSLYSSGDYLLCHDDQVEDRKIAYILYLSKGFVPKDGGQFVLFDNKGGKPSQEVQSHVPLWNHLMIFEVSNTSFHAVEENCSNKDRYAIGGWLH